MENQFVPYPIALDLKELGFDEPCFGYFNEKRMLMQFLHNVFYNKNSEIAYARNIKYLFRKEAVYKLMCTAPLWQQVIDWCDSKGLLVGTIIVDIDKFKSEIKSINYEGGIFNTRHESIRNAIEFAICYLQNNKPVD